MGSAHKGASYDSGFNGAGDVSAISARATTTGLGGDGHRVRCAQDNTAFNIYGWRTTTTTTTTDARAGNNQARPWPTKRAMAGILYLYIDILLFEYNVEFGSNDAIRAGVV